MVTSLVSWCGVLNVWWPCRLDPFPHVPMRAPHCHLLGVSSGLHNFYRPWVLAKTECFTASLTVPLIIHVYPLFHVFAIKSWHYLFDHTKHKRHRRKRWLFELSLQYCLHRLNQNDPYSGSTDFWSVLLGTIRLQAEGSKKITWYTEYNKIL